MKKLAIGLSVLLFSAYGFAEGLDTLIEAGKAQGLMARQAKEETDNFESAKKAIENGLISKGETKDSVRKRCGEPVIECKDVNTKKERWVYKRADASFFGGEKIYLVFDDKGVLEETKIVSEEKTKEAK